MPIAKTVAMNFKLFPLLLSLAWLSAAYGQSLKGKITLSAVPQLLAPHPVTKDQGACGLQVQNEALVIGKKLELANVIAFIANLKPETGLPHAVLPLEMLDCAFQPHVLAALPGDTLLLRNRDAILHDARGELYAFRSGWDRQVTKSLFRAESHPACNYVLPASEATAVAILNAPGLIRVRSKSGHDWMQAFILVVPHRGFAVSNAKGEFALPRLPAGKYDLVLWHEHLGVKRQLIELMAGKTVELLVTWEIPEEMKAAAATPPPTAQK